ncbi:MAG: 6,7-dimethyl-8-ribityllumazine synthase [Lysobacterales bacterium]|jgi:6,7-dimethyl-8-ribityllumazine synthase|nr:MAG: 6,7-dimethyl-8-ribityllumazine synthase [Xanthomonadales bacterium]
MGPERREGALRLPSGRRIALVAARYNAEIVEGLLEGALAALRRQGIADSAMVIVRVPGAWELPLAVRAMLERAECAAAVALACVLRGETEHFRLVVEQSSHGLMRASLDTGKPVGNGILAVERREQALVRSAPGPSNRGAEAALAALELADLLERLE